jgi:hypothetical protein
MTILTPIVVSSTSWNVKQFGFTLTSQRTCNICNKVKFYYDEGGISYLEGRGNSSITRKNQLHS